MALYEQLKLQIDGLMAEIKTAVADKQITLAEAVNIGLELFETVALVAESLPSTRAEKKALLLQVADDFYLNVIAPMDIPYVPDRLESLLDRALAGPFHKIVEGVIEFILNKVEGENR